VNVSFILALQEFKAWRESLSGSAELPLDG